MILSTLVIVLFYFVPLILMNLNVVMSYINHSRKENKFNSLLAIFMVVLSFVPIVNAVLTYIIAPAMNSEVFLISYLRGLNDAMKCDSCGIITRRHNLKEFEPEEDWIGEYKYSRWYDCPYCERSMGMREQEEYRKKSLPFGKRIDWITGMVKYFTLGLNKNEKRLKDLENKQSELEFADSQMEKWEKLQEEKLKRMERKMEQIKEDMKNNPFQ